MKMHYPSRSLNYRRDTRELICFALLFHVWQAFAQHSADIKMKLLSRQKRYLIFPEGSNVQLVYCLTVGAYGRETDMVIGLTAGLAWELPSKVDPKVTKLLHRGSRSVVFPKIEAFLQSIGLDGKACVMKALCEASQRNETEVGNGSFVQELLHVIFSLRNDGSKFISTKHQIYDDAHQINSDCSQAYPTCKHSIYDMDL